MRLPKPKTMRLMAGMIALGCTGPLAAQTSSLSSDLECLLGASAMASSDKAQVKAGGVNAALFFSGKVFARNPNIDLEAALQKRAATLDATKLPEVLKRCGNEMKARTDELSKASRNLAAKRK